MEKDITAKQRGWRVETRDAGTCYVPGDVQNVPDYMRPGVAMQVDGNGMVEVFDAVRNKLAPYVPGTEIFEIEVVEGYFGRWSAPGYLDCTEWQYDKTLRGIRDALSE